jgi:DNA invertase Pin-like site-specific DNA recombinase
METCLLLLPDDNPKVIRALATGPITTVIEAKPGRTREALGEIKRLAAAGTIEAVIIKTVRIAGVRRLLATLDFLHRCGVTVRSVEEPYLDIDKQGLVLRLLTEMLDQERRSSIADGVARARAQQRLPGRPRAVIPEEVFVLADKGTSLRAIARRTGLGASTIGRALQARRLLDGAQGSREVA